MLELIYTIFILVLIHIAKTKNKRKITKTNKWQKNSILVNTKNIFESNLNNKIACTQILLKEKYIKLN